MLLAINSLNNLQRTIFMLNLVGIQSVISKMKLLCICMKPSQYGLILLALIYRQGFTVSLSHDATAPGKISYK
jgi:hypothetical protein